MSDTETDDLGRKMALLAHRAAVEEISEIQQRLAMRRAMDAVLPSGDRAVDPARALPIQQFRRRISTPQVLSRAAELTIDEAKSDMRRLAELYTIVARLEAAFAADREAKDQAFWSAMAEHFRRREK